MISEQLLKILKKTTLNFYEDILKEEESLNFVCSVTLSAYLSAMHYVILQGVEREETRKKITSIFYTIKKNILAAFPELSEIGKN